MKKKLKFILDVNKESIIKDAIKTKKPILLVGETGTGKTTIIREIAKAENKELHRVSLNGATSVEEIIGKTLINDDGTFWQDGILLRAMKNGDWIVLDELNAALPDILFMLHALLDDDQRILVVENENELVIPHEDFRLFGSMNPPENYAGTKEMNTAFISRFGVVAEIQVLAKDDEIKLLESKGIKKANAEKLVATAMALRKLKEDDEIVYFCSTRDIIQSGELMEIGQTIENALLHTVVNKMSASDKELVLEKTLKKIATMELKASQKAKDQLNAAIDENKKLKKQIGGMVQLTDYQKVLNNLTSLQKSYEELDAKFKEAITVEKDKMQKIINSLVQEGDDLQAEIVKLKTKPKKKTVQKVKLKK